MVMATVKKDNAGVIVNPKGEMKGFAMTGPIGIQTIVTIYDFIKSLWAQQRLLACLSERILASPLSEWILASSLLAFESVNEFVNEENTDTTDDMKRILMMSFGSKWKESKHEAKPIGHDPYNTDIERLAHCPNRVEEDQWRSLVHYWRSKEAKVCARFLFLHLLY
uniref:Leucine-rich repeat resistance protein n=1 Tax=Solanum tuberosum TaxID=4113 RepID=M1BZI9_SOLTU